MKKLYASLLLTGCVGVGSDDMPPRASDAADAAASDTDATFGEVYTRVFMRDGCLLGLCHGEGASGGGLDLDPREKAHAQLVGVPATAGPCAGRGLIRVTPGEPEASLLLQKMSGDPPCGAPMPPAHPLTDEQLQLVSDWIAQGAPNN